jgi:hypothetical protein
VVAPLPVALSCGGTCLRIAERGYEDAECFK